MLFKLKFIPLLFGIIVLTASCKKDTPKSSVKKITALSIKNGDGTIIDISELSVTIGADSVNIVVPFYTDITNLILNIAITGQSITPSVTTPQSFTAPVIYTVTAEDESFQKYVVTIKNGPLKNVLYVGSNNNTFYALKAGNGAVLWQFTASKGFSYSDPIVSNGVVYTGCIDGNLYALDAAKGTLKWKFAAGVTGIESSPAVADGIVYFGSNNHSFYAVDAKTGNQVWQFDTSQNVSSSPVVVNGVVYFGSSDNYIYALNAKTGALIWRYAAQSMINQSSPVVHNEVLFIGSRDDYLYAINTNNGKLKWKYYTGYSLEQSSPYLSNGVLYVGSWYNFGNYSVGGPVYAINEITGTLLWKTADIVGFGADPVVSNNVVYISGDDTYLHAYNAIDGTSLWKVRILANGAGAMVANGSVFISGGGSGLFYALNATTGTVIWQIPISGITTSTPCVIDANGTMMHR